MENIFLFYGEDTYRSAQKLKRWQSEFSKKYGDESIEIIEGKNLNPGDFTTNIEAIPFLSEKRLIIVKNFLSEGDAENQKKVAGYLEKSSENCIIIFHETEMPDKRTTLFQKISKSAKIEEFKPLHPLAIAKWIIQKAEEEKINIDQKTANYLVEHCGLNLWSIAGELAKLKSYCAGKEVTKKSIDEICSPSLSSSIFKLTDAVAQKNTKQSLQTFEILRENGEDLGKIFFMMVRHFRILIQVHEMLTKGEKSFSITKKLKQHPFVIQKTESQSHNFSNKKLEEIYQKLLEIDVKVKTGQIKTYKGDNREFELALEQLIIDCCK